MVFSTQIVFLQRHYFANKDPNSQRSSFSSSHVWMWKLDHKESWTLKNWCFWIVVLEETLESPLNCKEIKPVNSERNQSWIFIWWLWPPDAKNWRIRKDPDTGKEWRQEKGTTETKMVGWCHWLNGQSLSKLQELVKDREAWHVTVHGVSKSLTWLSNWTSTRNGNLY